ncbi:unnamed protein product [Rotaria sordida]|uniref:Uncharacterized protein n=1 Tax=Rotaria sordida TaxID=392033 RepID=A0A818T702_9BILA|nr:unnamed protein product [Rotaria sordida]CAF1112405.1 unnamed protein product [Rotaria sordida]CAF1467405.1 unnamed protein product [Rotaria sordida]CAF3682908.1 unnamed protein product [Rotaria sordida]
MITMVVNNDDVYENESIELTYWLYYIMVYYVLQIICIITAFLNVQQYKQPEQEAVSTTTTTSTLVGMNVMGQLIDKAKRAIVMRTVNNEKSQHEQMQQEKIHYQSSQSNVSKSILPIRIQELEAKIENRATIIDEKSPAVLKYRTPHFRATATVKFPPLDEGEHWKIGWIQSCTRMDFFNSYGDCGYSSWEFPQLMSGQNPMISDSDGRNYPFYGSKSEVIEIQGPCIDYTTLKVVMNDNFYPHITWDIPTSNERLARLTNVKRHQSFYTWLVAMNARNGSILVLKTISWQMDLEINIDPTKSQGSRATLVSDPIPIQPEILKQNIRIPTCVLYPPNANSAQILVWHPGCHLGITSKRPEIVVPPRCMLVLLQNPFYANHIRHKTHTSIQNKLNGGSSSSSSSSSLSSSSSSPSPSSSPSSSSSESRMNVSQSLTIKPYSRLIFPHPSGLSSTSLCSIAPSNRCYNGMKYILNNHAKLAQGVMVR